MWKRFIVIGCCMALASCMDLVRSRDVGTAVIDFKNTGRTVGLYVADNDAAPDDLHSLARWTTSNKIRRDGDLPVGYRGIQYVYIKDNIGRENRPILVFPFLLRQQGDDLIAVDGRPDGDGVFGLFIDSAYELRRMTKREWDVYIESRVTGSDPEAEGLIGQRQKADRAEPKTSDYGN